MGRNPRQPRLTGDGPRHAMVPPNVAYAFDRVSKDHRPTDEGRMFYQCLWLHCDDYGRFFIHHIDRLMGVSEDCVTLRLARLEAMGLVETYEWPMGEGLTPTVGEICRYLQFPGHSHWKRYDTLRRASIIDPPPPYAYTYAVRRGEEE